MNGKIDSKQSKLTPLKIHNNVTNFTSSVKLLHKRFASDRHVTYFGRACTAQRQ